MVSRRLGGARRTGDVDGSEHREATGSEEGATVRAVDRRMGIDADRQPRQISASENFTTIPKIDLYLLQTYAVRGSAWAVYNRHRVQ